MPELSIIMRLKDLVTTGLKQIVTSFDSLTGKTKELAKSQDEAAAKTEAHKQEIKDLGKVSGETSEEMVAASSEAAEKIAKIQGYLTSVTQEENDKKLQDWNAFLSSTLDLTYETYDDLTEALGELNVKDREKLRSKFREWKRTLDSITEEEKEFYRKAKGYMGDFRDMTQEELENVKKLWEENVAKYEEIWDGFTQDVRSSFSNLFVDFMDGTKKSQDIWQDFCDSMVSSFKKALADSLVEKMGFDRIFEGNILNWGNLFTGLGNLVEGVFTGLGKAIGNFTTAGTTGFGTLGNVVGVFGKTLSGLVRSGGPLALVLGGMEAITRLVSGKSFIGGFLGGPMESEYSIERRKRFERERAGKEEQWKAQMLNKGFLIGWYGTMYHPETKEAYRWTGPGAEDYEAIEYPTYVAAQGAAFLEGLKLLQGGAVFNKPTFFRAIAGEGGEPEFLSPESLLRKIVREEIQRVPSTYSFGPINIDFPNVTSFQDWLDADPGTIKLVFDRKIYQAMKTSAREGRISKEALLM